MVAETDVLNAAVVVIDQLAALVHVPRVDRHLEGVEGEVAAQARRDLPADDEATEDVDDKGHVAEAGVGLHVGQVRDPEPVGSGRAEVALDEIDGALDALVGDRGLPVSSAANAHEPLAPHQALDGATRDRDALQVELAPDLVGAVALSALGVDAADLDDQLLVTQRPGA